jgi:hypothetical protein
MEEIVSGRELRIRSVDYHLPSEPVAPASLASLVTARAV